MAKVTENMAKAFILSKKPIFGLVEGRAIGFGFTQLFLFDRVFATENCSFNAPLVKLAQGPEMCSSYILPKMLGKILAE